ncbi:TetR/AcrR family transcriptional regulator [Arthrobacter sp. NA-172]|uniref:TetR/AcrR family transcriptional regulator n=1 Tax=Arthrobacter sp. NA-172 TaxID=3367524 RepID=UPI00375533F9
MARPVLHDDSLKERLLDTAADLVDRIGPARVTLRELAAEAGTSTTAVYSLFGGKSQLLTAVVDSGFRSFGDSQRAAADGGLRALGMSYRAWALSHPALYRLMFGGALAAYANCAPTPAVASDAMAPLIEAVAAAQAVGSIRAVPVETVSIAIWGQVHGLVSLELAELGPPTTDWESFYSEALDAVTRGWA